MRRVAQILQDPDTDLGFKTLDPAKIVKLVEDSTQFVNLLHGAVDNPAKRTLESVEIEARTSSHLLSE
jgi:hypothetical protein